MSFFRKNELLSVDEYLEAEKQSQAKHEYVRGHVYATVGASRAHNTLSLSLASRLLNHLHGSGCDVFVSDMKVRIGDIFYYPDVVVSCSKADLNPYFITEPALIAEVLSPATEAADRLDKRLVYQSLGSLKEYVLVSQDQRKVEVYRRSGTSWDLEAYSGQDVLRLTSVDFSVSIADFYGDVAG
jgi:Uma2 family endonuclease